MNLKLKGVFTIVFFISALFMSASDAEKGEVSANHQEETTDIATQNRKFIAHHVDVDSHDFTIITDEEAGKHYGFPLPVILWDNGFVFFMSSEFHHGESVVEKNGTYYKLFHGDVYKTDASGDLKLNHDHHPQVPQVLDLSITKTVFSLLLTAVLMCLFFIGLARSYTKKEVPTGFGRFLEPLVLYVRDDIAKANIGDKKYRKFSGYLLTVFFFILILNLLGMTPFGINATGNITITFFLAIVTYLITQFSGNKDYWKHIFWMPNVPVLMKIILMPIEILGTLTKPFALMIRLYANMTAGHIVIMTLIGLIYVFKVTVMASVSFSLLTLFIYVLELLVAFLQAYIFTMLSSLFIGAAVEEHEHH
ncbi:MAG: F0F1 ATP synthase subunit A [Flavobacteriales bacterium]|nr:F0F1 ATP synthase subunit A [Flavobacteriales bacterium]